MTVKQLFPQRPVCSPQALQRSAEDIWQAIANTYADCEQDPATLITYALCDLRHLIDFHGLDHENLFANGEALYAEERKGQPDGLDKHDSRIDDDQKP